MNGIDIASQSSAMLQGMALAIGLLTLTVIVGIFKPTQIMVALVRLMFIVCIAILVVVIVWGLGTMAFLYFSNTEVSFK
jgi:hypothetical protein